MTTPHRPLEADEPIGVVALSGPVDKDKLQRGLAVLSDWGHPLVLAANLSDRSGYLAGDDDARLDGLSRVMDRGARVLVAARGGYGVTRLFERLPWSRLVESGTSFVGFSDVTAVMNALVKLGGGVQVHGPMVAAGMVGRRNARHLRRVVTGDLVGQDIFRFPPESVVRGGQVQGPAMGGNLAMLTTLLGTRFEPDFDGCVLFIEEVGEPPYRLDRMLTHLSSSGTFRGVKALICGSLRSCRPAEGRAQRWRWLIEEAAPTGAVMVVDLPFGHGAHNIAFPIGATVEIDTEAGVVSWSS